MGLLTKGISLALIAGFSVPVVSELRERSRDAITECLKMSVVDQTTEGGSKLIRYGVRNTCPKNLEGIDLPGGAECYGFDQDFRKLPWKDPTESINLGSKEQIICEVMLPIAGK